MNISYSLLFNDLIAFTSYQANKQKDYGDIASHCFANKPGVGASGIGASKKRFAPCEVRTVGMRSLGFV